MRSGGRVERTRGGGINETTILRTRDFCAEAADVLIADDTGGSNSGVTIVGRASFAAGGRLMINYIVYLLSTL